MKVEIAHAGNLQSGCSGDIVIGGGGGGVEVIWCDERHDIKTHEDRVRAMMLGFGQELPEKPTVADDKTRILRARLMLEEVLEYCDAAGLTVFLDLLRDSNAIRMNCLTVCKTHEPSLVEIADALGDISVVTTGAFITHSIPIEPVLAAIDANNLLKVTTGCVCQETGKFLKAANHPKVDLGPILEAAIGDGYKI